MQNYNLSVPIKQYRYSEVKKMTNSFRDKLGVKEDMVLFTKQAYPMVVTWP